LGIVGGRPLFVLGVGLKDPIANRIRRIVVDNGTEQCHTPPRALHRELASRERYFAAAARPTFPNAEADQLQPGQPRCTYEVQLRVGELPSTIAAFARRDLDGEVGLLVGLHGSIHLS
jgi:hypothetical protein